MIGRYIEPELGIMPITPSDLLDAATVRYSPLAAPQGVNLLQTLPRCEVCDDRRSCHKSVMALGPFARPECEQALPLTNLWNVGPPTPGGRTARRKATMSEQCYEFVQKYPGMKTCEICAALGFTQRKAGEALVRLANRNLITRTRAEGVRGMAWRYYPINSQDVAST